MWTKKAHFIVISIRINAFILPIVLPAFILNSLVSELCDLVNFFTFYSTKVTTALNTIETVVYSFTDFSKYDFVNIDVKSKREKKRVKIRIYVR